VADTNALLDAITPEEFARDERLPYWAEIWASGIALAEWCLEGRSLAGKRVLDLGCGVGIAGIAAARSGAEVVLADYEPDALAFARHNAARNLPGILPEFRLLDWRLPAPADRFAAILGADVIYERGNFLPLLETFERLLLPDGEVILSDPQRQTAGPFLELAREWGYAADASTVHVTHRERDAEITIHRLRKSGKPGCRA
jgi:predicted nicotinamide N-methyase